MATEPRQMGLLRGGSGVSLGRVGGIPHEARLRLNARTIVEINAIVIVSLASPKEKIWGQLLALNSAGVTVRGIDLASFDDFLRQLLDHEEATVGLATVFYPMHRVERIAQDEPSGSIPSLADRFRAKIGLTIQEYLGLESSRI
jgi:hypothetical protein